MVRESLDELNLPSKTVPASLGFHPNDRSVANATDRPREAAGGDAAPAMRLQRGRSALLDRGMPRCARRAGFRERRTDEEEGMKRPGEDRMNRGPGWIQGESNGTRLDGTDVGIQIHWEQILGRWNVARPRHF